jgi:uncharacterized protein YhhL (DUF1145 family)
MTAAKWALLAVWALLIVASLAAGPGGWQTAARAALAFLLLAHLIECVLFLPHMRRAGGSLGRQLVQMLLFGALHARTLPRA